MVFDSDSICRVSLIRESSLFGLDARIVAITNSPSETRIAKVIWKGDLDYLRDKAYDWWAALQKAGLLSWREKYPNGGEL